MFEFLSFLFFFVGWLALIRVDCLLAISVCLCVCVCVCVCACVSLLAILIVLVIELPGDVELVRAGCCV